VDSAEYESTVSKLPDYEEYREDVEGILNQANLPKTRNHVIATYKMVVGERALAGEYKPRRTGPLPPSNPPTDPPKTDSTPKLTSLEQEIATAHGLTPEEWVANRDADDLALKLPGIDR
jgi:hypothetical protein